ncbi:MAG: transcription elongation factor GreA [Polyangia bacterium]
MAQAKIPMTPRGAQQLKDELKRRKETDRFVIVRAIEEARGHGDLSENADYSAAKEAQSFNEGRIKELEGTLALSEVIDPAKMTGSRVTFGATVKLTDSETGDNVVYSIVGEQEADIKKGLISVTAPVARALIGRESGDTVQVRTPKGMREYDILEVAFRDIEYAD